jgi:alpha-amylase/alpha-mannosidase (GH57 family)
MASTCFCFQVHQPDRLRRFTIFDTENDYFDGFENAEICRRVSRRCYLPANRLLREMFEHYHGRFKVSFSITGVLLEQLRDHAPDVLESFQALANTGCVEFLAQTYYNSLSFLFSTVEFSEQVGAHRELIQRLFGQRPRVFRNSERVYSNALARTVEAIGDFDAILVDGGDAVLAGRSCSYLYRPPNPARLKLLVKNGSLSDDVALRGSVNAYWKKLRAEEVTATLAGVRGVTNELSVVPTNAYEDRLIADSIVAALDRNVYVDVESVDVRVNGGVVTLSGSVSSLPAFRAAQETCERTVGVIAVNNELVIR